MSWRPLVVAALIVILNPLLAEAQAASRDIRTFPGLSRLFRDVSSSPPDRSPEQEAARMFDFEQVVLAIAGPAVVQPGHSLEDYRSAFGGVRTIMIDVGQGAAARDDAAYRLHSLGYSPKEIADILAGRITLMALDNAQKMLMVGYRAEQVSDVLDREYRRLRTARERAEARGRAEAQEKQRQAPRAPVKPGTGGGLAETYVTRFASAYGVDAALVRAVITCESGWNQDAVSRVGAIGLMQMMPGTARELRVDPRDLQQNIEGGVRYLASLLRAFKTVERALIAYNAGPGFAERYARGQAALYGETREFVKNVLGLLVVLPNQRLQVAWPHLLAGHRAIGLT